MDENVKPPPYDTLIYWLCVSTSSSTSMSFLLLLKVNLTQIYLFAIFCVFYVLVHHNDQWAVKDK